MDAQSGASLPLFPDAGALDERAECRVWEFGGVAGAVYNNITEAIGKTPVIKAAAFWGQAARLGPSELAR